MRFICFLNLKVKIQIQNKVIPGDFCLCNLSDMETISLGRGFISLTLRAANQWGKVRSYRSGQPDLKVSTVLFKTM